MNKLKILEFSDMFCFTYRFSVCLCSKN